jgi:hypothetical protein
MELAAAFSSKSMARKREAGFCAWRIATLFVAQGNVAFEIKIDSRHVQCSAGGSVTLLAAPGVATLDTRVRGQVLLAGETMSLRREDRH